MAELCPTPPLCTFIVRFWWEGTVVGPRWRGCIEHVQSGESAAFLELETMLSFLGRFGFGPPDRDQPGGRGRRTTRQGG
ncbi:MAG: hypothetical protein PVI07_08865 [Anaerolineae bacterium]|jgi:hypothetical protein